MQTTNDPSLGGEAAGLPLLIWQLAAAKALFLSPFIMLDVETCRAHYRHTEGARYNLQSTSQLAATGRCWLQLGSSSDSLLPLAKMVELKAQTKLHIWEQS